MASLTVNTPTVLLTLGRLPAALEIARAFKACGWRVIVAEPARWHLCRLSVAVARSYQVVAPVDNKSTYHRQLLDIIHAESVSLIIPVSEEILFVSQLRDQLPAHVALLSMAHDVLMQLHDKWHFYGLASSCQLPVPDTALAKSDRAAVLTTLDDYIVKPRLSCSGVGVRTGQKGTSVSPGLSDDQNIVQTRLSQTSCSSFAIARNGQCLKLVVYRSLLEAGSVSVCFESIDVPTGIERFISKLVEATQFTGMISFDFLLDETGQWQAIECNPRATSGIHLLSGAEISSALLQAAGLANSSNLLPSVATQTGLQRQEFWSSLTELEAQLFKGKYNKLGWRRLVSTQDISWSALDKKPCALMPFASAGFLWKALCQRKPISQVLMLDLGWYVPERKTAEPTPFRVSISPEAPTGLSELSGSTVFGTDGLRYRRLDTEESLARFHQPLFVCAHGEAGQLIGIYILDQRQLLVNGKAVTGVYRGALAVDGRWQGNGVAKAMSLAAVQWTEQLSQASGKPVLSYGCIDASNTRSLNLLARHQAKAMGSVSVYMMYRQWPRQQCTLDLLDGERLEEYNQLVRNTQNDCSVLDVTPGGRPAYVLSDEAGIRVGARISESTFGIVDMGRLLRVVTRLFVTPWPPARNRFNPDKFRHLVFTHIALREGCEKDWIRFVSSAMALHDVHFAITYPDTHSVLFSRLIKASLLGRFVHSKDGSINVMARVFGDDGSLDEALNGSETHALYPVDA